MAIEGFPDPFANCCFVSDELLYVCLFNTETTTHYHFLWSMTKRRVQGRVASQEVNGQKKNFPYKSYYNDEKKEIYTFYRQGQSFIIKEDDPMNFQFDQIPALGGLVLGQMHLVFNTALIAQTSSTIKFFKLEFDDIEERLRW